MYKLIGSHSFDAAHYLKGHDGKCCNLHGHRWTVEYAIKSKQLQSHGAKRGMVLDFGDLKKHFRQYIDKFDHKLLVEEDNYAPEEKNFLQACEAMHFEMVHLPFRTTAENFAAFFYQELSRWLHDLDSTQSIHLEYVKVYETPNNCAIFTMEE